MTRAPEPAAHTAWRPVEGAPGYYVSMDGEVLSTFGWHGQYNRTLTQTLNGCGYRKVRLAIDGKRRNLPVHKLVAEAWVGPCPASADQLRHVNGNRLDNRAENLAWGTALDNATDRAAHGRTSHGNRHSQAIKAGLRAKATGEGGQP